MQDSYILRIIFTIELGFLYKQEPYSVILLLINKNLKVYIYSIILDYLFFLFLFFQAWFRYCYYKTAFSKLGLIIIAIKKLE